MEGKIQFDDEYLYQIVNQFYESPFNASNGLEQQTQHSDFSLKNKYPQNLSQFSYQESIYPDYQFLQKKANHITPPSNLTCNFDDSIFLNQAANLSSKEASQTHFSDSTYIFDYDKDIVISPQNNLNQFQKQATYTDYKSKKDSALFILRNDPTATISSICFKTKLSKTKVLQIQRQYERAVTIRSSAVASLKAKEKVMESEKQNEAILQIINRDPLIGLQTLVNRLEFQFGITMRRSSLHKRLVSDLGFQYTPLIVVPKPISTFNDEQTILRRRDFCKELQKYNFEGLYVCGITSFTGCSKTNYAWLSRKNKKQQVKKYIDAITKADTLVNLLVTINSNQIIRYELFCGQITPQIFKEHLRRGYMSKAKKTINQVILFSDQLCQEFKKQYQNRLIKHSSALRDGVNTNNVKIQYQTIKLEENEKSYNSPICGYQNQIKEIMSVFNINYLFFPPFSPKINPCSEFFNIAHKKFRAYKILNAKVKTQDQIQSGINEVMNFMPQSQIRQYFKRLQGYLKVKQMKIDSFVESIQ